jgi:hypothetical protein
MSFVRFERFERGTRTTTPTQMQNLFSRNTAIPVPDAQAISAYFSARAWNTGQNLLTTEYPAMNVSPVLTTVNDTASLYPSSQAHDDREQRQHQHHFEQHVNIEFHDPRFQGAVVNELHRPFTHQALI